MTQPSLGKGKVAKARVAFEGYFLGKVARAREHGRVYPSAPEKTEFQESEAIIRSWN